MLSDTNLAGRAKIYRAVTVLTETMGSESQAPIGSPPTTAGHPPTPTAEQPGLMPQDDYQFPSHKLKRAPVQEGKVPLILVACGSFSVGLTPTPTPC